MPSRYFIRLSLILDKYSQGLPISVSCHTISACSSTCIDSTRDIFTDSFSIKSVPLPETALHFRPQCRKRQIRNCRQFEPPRISTKLQSTAKQSIASPDTIHKHLSIDLLTMHVPTSPNLSSMAIRPRAQPLPPSQYSETCSLAFQKIKNASSQSTLLISPLISLTPPTKNHLPRPIQIFVFCCRCTRLLNGDSQMYSVQCKTCGHLQCTKCNIVHAKVGAVATLEGRM